MEAGILYSSCLAFSSPHSTPSLNHLPLPPVLQQEMKTEISLKHFFNFSIIWFPSLVHVGLAVRHTEADMSHHDTPIKQSTYESAGTVLLHLVAIAEISSSKSTKEHSLNLRMNEDRVSRSLMC